jgi:hypothetical protein
VSARAGSNDVLVSSTLRDLMIGQDSSSKTAVLASSRACPANGISSPSYSSCAPGVIDSLKDISLTGP